MRNINLELKIRNLKFQILDILILDLSALGNLSLDENKEPILNGVKTILM